jgi:hypothetical protein
MKGVIMSESSMIMMEGAASWEDFDVLEEACDLSSGHADSVIHPPYHWQVLETVSVK